jgi:fructose-bisphosphate aldolase class II
VARITLRQLLDHAAEHELWRASIQHQQYGTGAGDHGGGRRKCDAPVIIQASRGARSYANDIMLAKHMMDALTEIHPAHSRLRASRPRQRSLKVPA